MQKHWDKKIHTILCWEVNSDLLKCLRKYIYLSLLLLLGVTSSAFGATVEIHLTSAEGYDYDGNISSFTNNPSELFELEQDTKSLHINGTYQIIDDNIPEPGIYDSSSEYVPSWYGSSYSYYIKPGPAAAWHVVNDGFNGGNYKWRRSKEYRDLDIHHFTTVIDNIDFRYGFNYHTVNFYAEDLYLIKANNPYTYSFTTLHGDYVTGPITFRYRNNPCIDSDKDGYYNKFYMCSQGNDCNDYNQDVHPNADEICGDHIDNNCNMQIDEGCCQINAHVNKSSFNLDIGAGGTVNVDGHISEISSKTVKWTMALAGQTFSGTGYTVHVNWNGLDTSGKYETKTYPATLHAETTDGKCSDDITFNITVTKSNSCMLRVTVGSAANIASGELTESIPLFSGSSGSPGLGLSLHYGSFDGFNGSMGQSWSHSFEIYLTENAFGEVALHKGGGSQKLYTPSGTGYISPPGDSSKLTKDADGLFTLTKKNGARYLFGSNGKINSIIDRNENALLFSYSADDLETVTDSHGRSITFSYANGKLFSITNPAGNTYQFSVGETLDSFTLPDGSTWQFNYQENTFLTAKIDPAGNLTTYQYDEQNRIIGSIDPEGRTRSIAYSNIDETVRTSSFTEKDGSTWFYTYDVDSGDLNGKTDPQGNVTQYSYDNQHNLLSKTEPGLGASYYSYDNNGNMTSMTDVDGNVTEYTYNDYGQMTSVTNPSHKTTTYTYDTNGNLTKVTDPSGLSSTYAYDSQCRLTSSINATGQSTTLAYDEQGNVASVTGVDGATTSFTYDVNGNRLSMTDALGNITRYEYDVMGRLEKVTDAQGNATKYEYDANDNRTSVTDANGKKTIFEYNFDHQMTSMTDAMGYTTRFTYGGSTGCSSCGGGLDKLTSLTDAKGQSTLFQYNALGNLLTKTDPLGHQTNYGYDAAGHIASKTDPNGNTIQYSYDDQGQLTAKSFPDGNQTVFSYDLEGNLLSAGNQHITYNYTYDASNRLISTTDSYGIQVKYIYDAAGNRTSLSSSNGIEITYAYDNTGRLIQIGSQAGGVIIGYDDLNRRASLGFPNGVKTSYDYDDLGRLTDLVTSSSSSIIAENHYTHDKVGNRLSNRDTLHTTNYTYDDDYRLTVAQSNTPGNSPDIGKNKGAANPTTNQREFYNYDAVGNRTTSSGHNTYSYNFGNELLHAGSVSYTYDANGNRTSKTDERGTTIYAWDYENRLTRVTLPDSSTITFSYDPFGRRISKTAGGITTTYTYDNEDILYETKDGAIDNFYIHGPGIDEPLALVSKKGAFYYHADGLGSIVAMTDDRARNVQQYEYDSYGNQHDMKNRIKQPYGYTGREHDRETGLRYYRARYYDGEVGRFISEDPIGFAGGDVNLYGYVLNDPSTLNDPKGKMPFYGNWCGPDWTGGYPKPWNELNPAEQSNVSLPVDNLDSCCVTHDKCYAKCREDYPCDADKRGDCLKRCDRNLSSCAFSCDVYGVMDFSIQTYFYWSQPGFFERIFGIN